MISGCELADWIAVMCVITERTEPRMVAAGVPEARMAYIPKGSYRNPGHLVCRRPAGHRQPRYRGRRRVCSCGADIFFTDPNQLDRPLSRMPFFATVCAGCAALCLGIAQAATDTLLELGASKVQVDPFPGLRDRPAVQVMVASSSAKLHGARLLLHEALGDLWATCQ